MTVAKVVASRVAGKNSKKIKRNLAKIDFTRADPAGVVADFIDQKRVIFFDGMVSVKFVRKMKKKILDLYAKDKKKPICLVVNSYGGLVTSMLEFYRFVTKLVKVKIITVAMGENASAANVIFLAGSVRYIDQYSSIFFHEVRPHIGDDHFTEAISSAEWSKLTEGYYRKIVASVLNIDPEEVREWVRDCRFFDAEDAVKHGLAHNILK